MGIICIYVDQFQCKHVYGTGHLIGFHKPYRFCASDDSMRHNTAMRKVVKNVNMHFERKIQPQVRMFLHTKKF